MTAACARIGLNLARVFVIIYETKSVTAWFTRTSRDPRKTC
jgi:hypothetical protein